MSELKQEIITELDSRIQLLKSQREHRMTQEDDNQYAQLNHALSRVIGVSLCNELEDIRQFVDRL